MKEKGAGAETQPWFGQNLAVAALGVVFGDIGTSPLYTIKLAVGSEGAVTQEGVFGVLSLIAWSLTLVVTVKYVAVLMRADNRGEGGILALTALALRATGAGRPRLGFPWVLAVGLFGVALFYGDGVLTPAISVLSAVEGLDTASPALAGAVVPLSLLLLLGLFAVQRRGTGRIGGFFGPLMVGWFVLIGVLGLLGILRRPGIVLSLDPRYAIDLLRGDPARGFTLLGAIVLAVTGAEALYADMGHFGATPIRNAWFFLVFPALMLNYLGQGALLLAEPLARENPFFHLAPLWAIYPLVVLAAAATVIASQAVISGAFSLAHQAVQLGYLPRMQVLHTSAAEMGQVYVPGINALLLLAVSLTVIGFGSSEALGSAYGIAVTGTMTATTVLAFTYVRRGAGWPLWLALPVFALFLVVDLSFFSANLLKIAEGGWFPLAIGAASYTLMTVWIWGRAKLAAQRASAAPPLSGFLETPALRTLLRVPGTAIYVTARIDAVPWALLHNMKHNKVLHEKNLLMTVRTRDVPRLAERERLEIHSLEANFHTVAVSYGFMERPDIPRALVLLRAGGFGLTLADTSFFIGHEEILAKEGSGISLPFKKFFILLSKLSLRATEFFRLPVDRVVELGGEIEI